MKKYLVCVMLLIMGCLTGCQEKETVSVPELLEPVEVEIDTAAASYGEMYKVATYNGEIVPYVEEISFEVDGTLDEISVIIGQEVEKGQVLASLDVEALEEEIEALEENISDIKKTGEFADRKALLNIEIAKEELEIMIKGTATDEACSAKEIAIEKMGVELRQAQEVRDLELEKLNVLLAKKKEKMDGTTITAPCAGQIVYIGSITEGSQINAHTTIMCIADKERLSIQTEYISKTQVDVAEKIYAKIQDSEYDITYVPIEDNEYISVMLSGGEVKTKFELVQDTDDLECGQFVVVMFLNAYKENVLTIPVNALYHDANGRYVYKIEDGKQVRCDIEVGMINDVEAEILGGLEEGDVVYVKE